MGRVKTLLLVGTFAKRVGLSPSALRYYDDVGLLKPARVDEATGYRYYSETQLEQARLIRFLRSLELPIGELRAILAATDSAALAAHLKSYRRDVKAQLDEKARMLTEIKLFAQRQLEPPAYAVGLKEVPAHTFLSIRRQTPTAALFKTMSGVSSTLLRYLQNLQVTPVGPWFTLYHNADYNDVEVDIEVCVPTPRSLASEGEIRQGYFCEQTHAWTVHRGPYERIGQAYRALQSWLDEHGYKPAGPIRDICLVGPAEVADVNRYSTEVAWPVTREEEV